MKNTGMFGNVSCETEVGSRFSKEDRYLVHTFYFNDYLGGTLLAVMDGYNGKQVAELCKESIPKLFNPTGFKDIKNALRRLILELNKIAGETGYRGYSSGSCISIACIPKNFKRVYVAVLGDIRVITLDRYENIYISPEHNIRTNEEERNMAIKRGGIYSKDYMYIPQSMAHDRSPKGRQVSRALGDIQMGDIVSHEPLLYSVPLGPKSIVVVASDGMLDPTHQDKRKKTLNSVIQGILLGENAEELLKRTKIIANQNLHDDATIIVWKGPEWKNAHQHNKIALCSS